MDKNDDINNNSIVRPFDCIKPIFAKQKLRLTIDSNVCDRVLTSFSEPIIQTSDPQFSRILRDISDGIRYVFQTRNRYSLAINGSGVSAMETIVTNIMQSKQTLLVLEHGIPVLDMTTIGETHGFKVIESNVRQFGHVFDLRHIKDVIETHKPNALFISHGNSSIGTLQPLEGIGQICHENGCLLVVDVSSSVCCSSLNTDQLAIDVIFSSSTKALSLPPGLSIVSLSDRAVNCMESRKFGSNNMNILLMAKTWGLTEHKIKNKMYDFLPPFPLLNGLKETLTMIAEEGLLNVIERHKIISLSLEHHIIALGLKFLVELKQNRIPGITSLVIPKNINSDHLIRYISDKYNVEISSTTESRIGQIWTIALFGSNADHLCVTFLCQALRETFNKFIEINQNSIHF